MNEKNIVLNNVEAAKEFVKAAAECDFDIDVTLKMLMFHVEHKKGAKGEICVL